jgi:hypothetical protein
LRVSCIQQVLTTPRSSYLTVLWLCIDKVVGFRELKWAKQAWIGKAFRSNPWWSLLQIITRGTSYQVSIHENEIPCTWPVTVSKLVGTFTVQEVNKSWLGWDILIS